VKIGQRFAASLPGLKQQMDKRERLRAENAAQAKQIETMKAALDEVLAFAWAKDQTEEAFRKMLDRVRDAKDAAIFSLPPSDMRLVPLERLREIEWFPASSDQAHWYECPSCGATGILVGWEVDAEIGVHAPDCWLDDEIKGDTCTE
jgi:hypothetical protein